jgi:gluconate 2-dehydrogenase gamma chain
MSKLTRRDSIKLIAFAGISAGAISGCVDHDENEDGQDSTISAAYPNISEEDASMLKQKFFTEDEREMVRVLANQIIPEDERSGNAESAGVVEFIEFMMLDQPQYQSPFRGGLNWINNQARKRFNNNYIQITESQQKEILDAIAYPDIAEQGMQPGVAFFNRFRNFVATGFWTSEIGIQDLQYMGNKVWKWEGAPQEWLDRLGVSYE